MVNARRRQKSGRHGHTKGVKAYGPTPLYVFRPNRLISLEFYPLTVFVVFVVVVVVVVPAFPVVV